MLGAAWHVRLLQACDKQRKGKNYIRYCSNAKVKNRPSCPSFLIGRRHSKIILVEDNIQSQGDIPLVLGVSLPPIE